MISAPPLYAILLNPGSSRAKRYAATMGGPGATTGYVRFALKFSTMPDAVIWVEQHQGKFPRSAPLVVPVTPREMEDELVPPPARESHVGANGKARRTGAEAVKAVRARGSGRDTGVA